MASMTETGYLRAAIIANGGTCDDLPDNLESTLYKRLIEVCANGGGGGGGGGGDLPTALPNPYPLTINGTSYNGSSAVNLTIEATGGAGGGGPNLVCLDILYESDVSSLGYDYAGFMWYDGEDGPQYFTYEGFMDSIRLKGIPNINYSNGTDENPPFQIAYPVFITFLDEMFMAEVVLYIDDGIKKVCVIFMDTPLD